MLAEAFDKESAGRTTQPQLLAMIDAAGCAAVGERATRAHFDEHQRDAVAHDEVELAELVADVGGDVDQARAFQQAPGVALRVEACGQPFRGGRARRRGTPP